MTTKYSFKTKILSVKEHFTQQNWRLEKQDNGEKKPTCDNVSDGWFIILEGSRESIYLGDARPDLVEGQKVTVSITPDIGAVK
jgi:hypothetical protein